MINIIYPLRPNDNGLLIIPENFNEKISSKDIDTESRQRLVELIGENLKEIDELTFEECANLKRVSFPNINKIGIRAFNNCIALEETIHQHD